MQIREYVDADWPAIWPIFREVVAAGDTFAYDPGWSSEQAREVWVESPPGLTVVALDGSRVLGTAKMGPNRPGPGSHVSTASFMVVGDARGRGVGRALGEYALSWARGQGYAANAVQRRRRDKRSRCTTLAGARVSHHRNSPRGFRAPCAGPRRPSRHAPTSVMPGEDPWVRRYPPRSRFRWRSG